MGGAIFGRVSFKRHDNKEVQTDIRLMRNALASWGPDGEGSWINNMVGLGQVLLFNTREAVNENLPRSFGDNRFIITSEARIDNRAELFHQIEIPIEEQKDMTDSELIVRAYQKWGTECPDYLLGDWSFAIWDSQQKRLFVARDHHGTTSFYYFWKPPYFAFASSKGALLTLPRIPHVLNETRIMQTLVVWKPPIEETEYVGIHRLRPAHAMEVSKEGVKVWRYWQLEDTKEIRRNSRHEYIEEFLDIYTNAVRGCLRHFRPVCATLSGGLDSSSVCALAAKELKLAGHSLKTFTSIPHYSTNKMTRTRHFGDESAYVNSTARFVKNINHSFIDAANITPVEATKRMLVIHDAPNIAPVNYHWLLAIHDAAKKQGFGAVLTGQTGNGSVSWSGLDAIPSASSFICDGRLFRALRIFIFRLLPRTLQEIILNKWFPRKTTAHNSSLRQLLAYSAINPDYAEQIGLRDLCDDVGHDPTFTFEDARQKRFTIIRPGDSPGNDIRAEFGGFYGQEIRDPTANKRVLEFCLSVPEEQYTNHNRGDRWLIRLAMRGLLPNKVRMTSQRGKQSADISKRVAANHVEIERELKKLENCELAKQILNLPRLREVLNKTQILTNPNLNDEVACILLRGLGVGMFLLNFQS